MVTSDRRKWLALGLLSAVQFMVVLDIAIVNVALPSIKLDLGFSQENLQWVISAYALVFGGFLLLGGRAADLLGRRRIFLGGVVLFTVASFLAGMAWSEGSLIGARAVQGLGAAIISPAALSILSTTFREGRERNIALGVWGAVGGFGAAAGVLLGGVLTDALSWEWIFFVNVPVGIAAFVLAPLLLAESRDASVKSFDVPGAVLVTGGLSSLVYAITQAGQQGWLAGETIAFSAAALVLLVGFVAWELRHPEPLMRLGIFQIRTVSGANVAGFILGTALFAMFLMLTLYMQQVLGYSAMKTGIAYLAVAGTAIVWSAVAAQLVTRIGVKPVLVAGMATLHAGLGRRLVRRRSAARVPLDRVWHRLLLRSDLDRGSGRCPVLGGGARLGPDQHVAADRRRARNRGSLYDRELADRRLPGRGLGGSDCAGRRLHGRLRRRRRDRGPRDPRRLEPDPARGARAGAGSAARVRSRRVKSIAGGPETVPPRNLTCAQRFAPLHGGYASKSTRMELEASCVNRARYGSSLRRGRRTPPSPSGSTSKWRSSAAASLESRLRCS